MKALLAFGLLFFGTGQAFSQEVYSVNYESQADVKVFVVDYESQADLKVYKVAYSSQASGN